MAPAELEAVILKHESVEEVIVVGVPDPYSQEIPRAYVVLKSGKSATASDIERHVQGTLFISRMFAYYQMFLVVTIPTFETCIW